MLLRLLRFGIRTVRKGITIPLALVLAFLITATVRFDVTFQTSDNLQRRRGHSSTRDHLINNVQEPETTISKSEYKRSPFIQTGSPIGELDGFSKTKEKVILLWTTRFKQRDWMSKQTPIGTCATRCRTTMDRGQLLTSDAVIMHAADFDSLVDLPRTRLPHQRWVYHGTESPPHTHGPVSTGELDGIFNWTATYRLDADILIRWGHIRMRNQYRTTKEHDTFLKKAVRPRKRLAMARISHCQNKTTTRISYIRELQKFAHVDFYGECGDYTCPKHNQYCDHEIMKHYKFFLAFENSYCREYITEKFWFPLGSWNAVPVVWGGVNGTGLEYSVQAPHHSFINKADFASPKELGQFLTSLNKNKTRFERYFDWRREADVMTGYDWCLLCDALHDQTLPVQTYTDLKGWYTQDVCQQSKPKQNSRTVKPTQQSKSSNELHVESIFNPDLT